MKDNGGSKENVKGNKRLFENAGFIDALIDEGFVNVNPRRDIYNVTFTFPKEAKEDISNYIKNNGKKNIVELIIGEVEKCRKAEVK